MMTQERTRRYCSVFIGLVLLFMAKELDAKVKRSTRSCEVTKKTLADYGLNSYIAPKIPFNGKMQYCSMMDTCCTPEIENAFLKQSKVDLEYLVSQKCSHIENLFSNKTKQFDEFFTELIDECKMSLHKLFIQTYGDLYGANAKIFMDFFDELKKFYQREPVRVDEIVDSFFTSLTQNVFKLMNFKRNISDAYMDCIGEHMGEMKPLGRAPDTFATRLHRAFTAARSFVQGLKAGRDLAKEVAKVETNAKCQQSIMQMNFCPKCAGTGQHPTKPCHKYCLDVMQGCFQDHASLSEAWRKYIDVMQLLLNRLDGPHNIEKELDSIAVKISDIIMTLQEFKPTLNSDIFELCGEPPLKNISVPDDQPGFGLHDSSEVTSMSPADLEKYLSMYNNGQLDPSFFRSSARTRRSTRSKKGRKRRRSRGDGRRKRVKHVVNKKKDLHGKRRYINQPFNHNERFIYNDQQGPSSALEIMVTEAKKSLLGVRNYWGRIPGAVCRDHSLKEAECWAPTGHRSFEVGDVAGAADHVPSDVVRTQRVTLVTVTMDLRIVYDGRDPNMIDDEDRVQESSGDGDHSGSGEGSGAEPRNDNDGVGQDSTRNLVDCPTCGATRTQALWGLLAAALAARWALAL